MKKTENSNEVNDKDDDDDDDNGGGKIIMIFIYSDAEIAPEYSLWKKLFLPFFEFLNKMKNKHTHFKINLRIDLPEFFNSGDANQKTKL